jgi:hypothetical protein
MGSQLTLQQRRRPDERARPRCRQLPLNLSFAFCAFVAGLWVRSYRCADQAEFLYRGNMWELALRPGGISVDNQPEVDADASVLAMQSTEAQHIRDYLDWDLGLQEQQATVYLHSLSGKTGPEFDAVWGRLQARRSGLAQRLRSISYRLVPGERGRAVPCWALLLFAFCGSIRPCARVIRDCRRARFGLCAGCGYDMRASPEFCPECGAACKAASPAGVSPAAGD